MIVLVLSLVVPVALVRVRVWNEIGVVVLVEGTLLLLRRLRHLGCSASTRCRRLLRGSGGSFRERKNEIWEGLVGGNLA
jgi:hypothetical protein